MGDVLEQFKIVFSLDNKPLEDGIKQTETTLMGLGKTFMAVFAGIASFGAIKKITDDFVELNIQLGFTKSLTGASVESIQSLGNALQRFGGSAETVSSSLKSMGSMLEQAKRGQGALIEVARRYGISFNPWGKAEDNIKGIVQQLGKFSAQQRTFIGGQLGLDESLIIASEDGGKALDELMKKQKELGLMTEEDTKLARNFKNAQLDLKDMFNSVTRELARYVIPSLIKMTDLFTKFIEWVKKNKELVISFFLALAVVMAPVIASFVRMAVATAVAFAPILTVVGVVAGLALIVEDIYGYFMGWESVTGKIADKFPVIKEILEGLRPLVDGINQAFEDIVKWLKDPSWSGLIDIFKNIGMALVKFLKQPFDAFANMFDGWVNNVKMLGSQIGGFFGFENGMIQVAPVVPQQSSVVNSNKQSTISVNNKFNQNITTATPKQFADSTNKQIIDSINSQRLQQGALD